MADQTTNQTGQTMGEPINEEIGRDESWFARVASEKDAWFSNQKRTYDEYQQESLESIKQNRTLFDKVLTDAQQYDNTRQQLAIQALQNAVETANMVAKQTIRNVDYGIESANMIAKQAVRHGDIAIDQEWNPIQQSAGDSMLTKAVQLDDASLKAIGAAVAAAVVAALATKE
jgi:hypothetical protein